MERGSSHHAPRVDDELATEAASMLHGHVLSGRDREDLEPEVPAADEEGASPDIGITAPEPEIEADVPAHGEVLTRSELARWLLPSSFPARAATLTAVARTHEQRPTAPEAAVDPEPTTEPIVVAALAPTGAVPLPPESDSTTGTVIRLLALPPRLAIAAAREIGARARPWNLGGHRFRPPFELTEETSDA